MITREEIRTGFATLETNEQKAEFCRQHMEQEQELPELYENLIDSEGRKLFNFKGLYETWSSDSPRDYITMKYYGMTMREYTMKKITKTSKDKSTEEMIEDVTVEVPNVKEDDVSRIIGEMEE
jgi:hypothetical protein|tara:strand:- start:963 stop:1331 length:369 start_codon:yes stop_codon:yes gene_type:complete